MASKIPVRPHPVPFDSNEMGGSTVQVSTSNRSTEEAAEDVIENGRLHEATNTIAEWHRQGLTRCRGKCGMPRRADEYRTFKMRGVEYSCKLCRECEAAEQKERRFASITPLTIYPKRVE